MHVKWVPTNEQLADAISRRLSTIESKLRFPIRKLIMDIFDINMDMFASNTNKLWPDIPYLSEFPDDEAHGVDGLAYNPKESDKLYCFPPFKLRIPVVNRLSKFSNQAVFVLTIQNSLKQDLAYIFSKFDYYIRLGPSYKAVIRPAERLVTLDGKSDYFTTYDKVVDTVLLLKGINLYTAERFERNLRPLLPNPPDDMIPSPLDHFISSHSHSKTHSKSKIGSVKDLNLNL